MKPLFAPEELAELAAFDAEIDDEPLTAQDYRESAQRDKDAIFAEKSEKLRRKARKIAAYQREYYEANKDQIAAKKRERMSKHRKAAAEASEMKIGDRICEARRRAGLNQKTLAAKAGIYQPQLSNYERGLITPTWRVLVRIADVLGVTVGELIYAPENR